MRSILISALAFCTGFLVNSQLVDTYVQTQTPISQAGLLANIGPLGSRASGAKAGIVIASPSTSNPNYLFTWTRDSALVLKTLIDDLTNGGDSSLNNLINDYVTAQENLQQVSNPSGSISTGGLGEPKFNVDKTAFTESWGRPQRDGPALRATALITYAEWLLSQESVMFVNETLWPVIKLDLDYTARYWNQTGFDLWEEVASSSFFTTAVQHRALRQGNALARTLGRNPVATQYSEQADNILCFLQTYWNADDGFITSNTGGGRSGIDANSILASIHTFDIDAGCDSATFQPCSDKALASLKVYVDSFRNLYPINTGVPPDEAVATGRYPEDVYFGGHPWYLTTAAVAEQLYSALAVWEAQGSLEVTEASLPFFQQFLPSVTVDVYEKGSTVFVHLIDAINTFADGFLAVLAKYTPADGSLSEQFDRNDGTPLSAVHLTWSYASTLTAFSARNGTFQKGWGAKGLKVPSVCKSNPGPQVTVFFNVEAATVLGENVFLTGSVDALKGWSPDDALALSPTFYPVWNVTVDLPANTMLQYKYIRKQDGRVTWESDPNNELITPEGGELVVKDTWR